MNEKKQRTAKLSGAAMGLALLLCVMALLAIAACGGSDSAPDDSAEAQPTPTPVPTPTAREIVDGASSRMAAIASAGFLLAHETGTTNLSALGLDLHQVEGQVVTPDRAILNIEATATTQAAFFRVKIIVIGPDGYLNLLNRWSEIDPEILFFNFSTLGQTLSDIIKAIREPAAVGLEEVQGVETWRVTGWTDSSDFRGLATNAASGHRVDLEAWIGADDSLLYRARLTGRLFDDDQADVVRVLTVTDIDAPFEIEAPVQ